MAPLPQRSLRPESLARWLPWWSVSRRMRATWLPPASRSARESPMSTQLRRPIESVRTSQCGSSRNRTRPGSPSTNPAASRHYKYQQIQKQGPFQRRCECCWTTKIPSRAERPRWQTASRAFSSRRRTKRYATAPHELALDIEPMDPARIPDGPAGPRPEIAAAIGAVLGLALSAIVAATLGWLREPSTHGPTVLTTDAAEPN